MIYANFDLETTGRSPDHTAMIQVGIVLHNASGWTEEGAFVRSLVVPRNRVWETDTLTWWLDEPARATKLATILKSGEDPRAVMNQLFIWLTSRVQEQDFAFVANPIAYDLPFLSSYMHEYVGRDWAVWSKEKRCDFGGVDLPTLAMATRKVHYSNSRRSAWPSRWLSPNLPHTHDALDDARHQAHAFIEMMKEVAGDRT